MIKETGKLMAKYAWIPEQVKTFVELAPTVVLTGCNSILLTTAKIVSKMEKWDYSKDRIQQEIGRIWVSKILNLVIFIIANAELAF